MDDTEKKLWQRLSRTKRQAARDQIRNQLVELYMPLADHIAQRQASRLPPSVDFDDMHSAAYQGLLDAIPRYDLSRGVTPKTFLTYRIKGCIRDWFRQIDSVSRYTRMREARVNHWAQMELDHRPTEDEIEQHFGFVLHRPSTVSLHESRDYDAGEALTLGEILPDHRTGPSDSGVGELSEIMRSCSQRERLALLLYHVDGLHMKEVAESLGVSESRISQMMSALKTRLRAAHAA